MKISFILSPAMGFIPEDVLQNTFEMVRVLFPFYFYFFDKTFSFLLT
jgi:hypothetical protein